MRISRLYLNQSLTTASTITLEKANSHYIRNVLRLKHGSTIALFNGVNNYDYQAALRFEGKKTLAEIISSQSSISDSELDSEVIMGVSRSDHIDFSIQKCTELGVNRLSIFNAQHSQNPLKPAQQEKRLAHWQAIAIKACEQCGRHRIPEVRFHTHLEAMLEHRNQSVSQFLLDFEGPGLPELLSTNQAGTHVSLLTGPEGGLASSEISLAIEQGFLPAHLGPRVLRTETATIVGLTIIQAMWGDIAC